MTPGRKEIGSLELGEQVADVGIGPPLVEETGDKRKLLAPVLDATGGM